MEAGGERRRAAVTEVPGHHGDIGLGPRSPAEQARFYPRGTESWPTPPEQSRRDEDEVVAVPLPNPECHGSIPRSYDETRRT